MLWQAAPQPTCPKSLAAFVGMLLRLMIESSGTSVYHHPTSRHYGPSALRKLLFLASMSVSTHSPQFRLYSLRKAQEGKAKKIILNNIANKLLKVMVAVIRSAQNPLHRQLPFGQKSWALEKALDNIIAFAMTGFLPFLWTFGLDAFALAQYLLRHRLSKK